MYHPLRHCALTSEYLLVLLVLPWRRLLRLVFLFSHPLQVDLERVRGVDDSWMHVLLAGQLDVKRLNLRNHSLSDEGMTVIANAKKLERLLLGLSNKLTNATLHSIGHSLHMLSTLEINGCPNLTPPGLEALSQLLNLQILDLSMCKNVGGGMQYIAQLPKLQQLGLGWCYTVNDCDVHSLAEGVCAFTLKQLNLTSTSVTSECVDSLSSLEHLQSLSIEQTHIEDRSGRCADALANLKELRSLNLRGISLRNAALRTLCESLCGLEELNLGFTLISDTGLTSLHNLQRLRVLDLDSCKVSDTSSNEFAALRNLRVLNLSDTLLGGGNWHSLSFLQSMPNLRWLDISFAGLFDLHLENLHGLNGLRYLACDSRLVTNEGLQHILCHRHTLEHLNVYSCRISDHGAAMISRIRSLRSLELCGSILTDDGVRTLCNLHNLEHLNLQQNYISDAPIPMLVASMPKLQSLNLANTRISGAALSELSKLPWLRTLTVNGCRISQSSLQRFQQRAPHVQSLSFER